MAPFFVSGLEAKLLIAFFLLVFALTAPLWVIGAFIDVQLLPGLPLAALSACTPAIAALIVVAWTQGGRGVRALLARAVDVKRMTSPIWIWVALLTIPLVTALAWVVVALQGTPPPLSAPPVVLAVLFIIFTVTAIGEELGWSGFALDRMEQRWGALRASLLLGAIWAVWHIPALIEAHRAPGWIAWWVAGTVATRVVMVWLYDCSGRSVFATVLFHAMINLSWMAFLAAYDPMLNALLLWVLAIAVIVWRRPAVRLPSSEATESKPK